MEAANERPFAGDVIWEVAMYEIEHGSTVERERHKYPFDKLGIVDSFFVPIEDLPPCREQSVRVAACRAGQKLGRVFATRSVKGGIRVWRVE